MSSAPGAATPAVAPWESPAALPPLGDDDIHVWRADRGAFARHHAACLACLAPDERARQARFHFERDRDRFAVAHAVKRLLLAHYAACRPDDVAFVTGAHGKPSLAGAAHAIEFNMTDTSDLSLIAVTRA
ncbi:MAG: hypothetical protein HY275_13895, partial [Gemmatimonadetes bacterium]|nr:hypothetical protein [Gemmatimonadota bacterium]